MGYVIRDKDGEVVAGDEVLDDEMRKEADRIDGTIEDDRGNQVYP